MSCMPIMVTQLVGRRLGRTGPGTYAVPHEGNMARTGGKVDPSMDPAIALAVFPVIFLGELPDKTMFASLVLASRGRPLAVWVGAAGAFLVHVVIAVTIGVGLFHLLPHRAVEVVVATMFLVGAVLAFREAFRVEDAAEAEVDATSGRIITTAFIVIFLAEWGDLTQILTANLAAHYHSAISVAIGSVLACGR